MIVVKSWTLCFGSGKVTQTGRCERCGGLFPVEYGDRVGAHEVEIEPWQWREVHRVDVEVAAAA